MQTNHLVTGPPRSGKTTVIERTLDQLNALGVRSDGLYSPEIRVDGARVGFELVDIATAERTTLAHVDREEGPAVGKYHVNVEAVDEFAGRVFARARTHADIVVVDEVAPMQLHSSVFVSELEGTLDSDVPVLAAVQFRSSEFVEDLKQRPDVRLYRVTPETRETLPERLAVQFDNSLD